MLGPEHPCPECGGPLALVSGPGRVHSYRGVGGYEVPADMVIPTCSECGSEWLDSTMVSKLGELFEAERQKRA